MKRKMIRIRAVDGPAASWLTFRVVHESEVAIHIDNDAKNPLFRCAVTLCKMPDGTLENSAGQKFYMVVARMAASKTIKNNP